MRHFQLTFTKPAHVPDPPPDYVYVGGTVTPLNLSVFEEVPCLHYFYAPTPENGWVKYNSMVRPSRDDNSIFYALRKGSAAYNQALELYPEFAEQEQGGPVTAYEF